LTTLDLKDLLRGKVSPHEAQPIGLPLIPPFPLLPFLLVACVFFRSQRKCILGTPISRYERINGGPSRTNDWFTYSKHFHLTSLVRNLYKVNYIFDISILEKLICLEHKILLIARVSLAHKMLLVHIKNLSISFISYKKCYYNFEYPY
jgi:hypothetical protein